MTTVFCDESGFTGENLWQEDQPYFVYAAVSVTDGEASAIVESVRREFSIQASELHAAQLIKRSNGRRAVMSVVESLVARSSVVIFHKRYSLAGKMFEYLVEPAIADGNSIFYDIGFHKFIANGLYLALLSEPSTTAQTFADFQEVMRTGDAAKLEHMTNGMCMEGMAGFLGQISTFIACNREAIQEEIVACESDDGIPRWMLELTTTALISLLASLSGTEMRPLSVTCDDSKPLLHQAEMFDSFVNRSDYHEMNFDGRSNQITFNLAHKIKFASSKTTHGLQLADLVAGAAAFAMKRPDDDFASFWRNTCSETVHQNSVVPDFSECDLSTERGVVNAFVLNELVDRSVQGQGLLQNMGRFIRFAKEIAPQFLSEQEARIGDS